MDSILSWPIFIILFLVPLAGMVAGELLNYTIRQQKNREEIFTKDHKRALEKQYDVNMAIKTLLEYNEMQIKELENIYRLQNTWNNKIMDLLAQTYPEIRPKEK